VARSLDFALLVSPFSSLRSEQLLKLEFSQRCEMHLDTIPAYMKAAQPAYSAALETPQLDL